MRDFLDHILPEAGWRCATLFSRERISNHFFETNEQLSLFMLRCDGSGDTVYHACATYKTTTRRKRDNVAWIKSFWVDLDVGPSKPGHPAYPTLRDALYALGVFCQRGNLPLPTVVLSGHGVHAYWVLAQPVELGQWLAYARGLKSLTATLGLHCDPARTSDAASILRSPSTHNRKDTVELPVRELCRNGPYLLEQFAGLLHDQKEQPQTIQFGDTSHLARRTKGVASLSLANLGSREPRTCERLAERCPQIGRLRATGGRLQYDLWRACITVLAVADDCDRFGHEWSSKHDNYTRKETQEKIDDARRFSQPHRCDTFAGLDPAPCANCRFRGKITSPAELGYQNEPGQKALENTGFIPIENYAWNEQKQLVFQQGTGEGHKDVLLCQYPLQLSIVSTNEIAGDHTLTFTHQLPTEPLKHITVGMQELFGPNGLQALTRHGVVLHDADLFRNYVRFAIDTHHKQQLHKSYEQFGFKPEGFLYGRYLYSGHKAIEVPVNKELQIRSQWLGPGCGSEGRPASLDGWKNAANKLFGPGCEAHAIAVISAFAAPIMYFVGARDEGGVVLSLVSPPGEGKTVALTGAYTVWGLRRGLSLTNDDNRVTKFLTLGAMGNLPVIYDEIDTRDPIVLRQLITSFTLGRDKMRADNTGQIRHNAMEWQTIMLTASNASPRDLLAADSGADAPAFRIFELEPTLPPHLKNALGEKLQAELRTNAGYAGEAFARYLCDVRNELPGWVESVYNDVNARINLPTQFRFWKRLIAAIGVAGTIVRKLELLDISVDRLIKELFKAARQQADAMHDKARGTMPFSSDWAFLQVSQFVAGIKDSTLVVQGSYFRNQATFPITVPYKPVIARYETSNKLLIVTTKALKDYAISQGFPFNTWQRLLKSETIMSDRKKYTLTAGTEIAGAQEWCHEISLGHPKLNPDAAQSNVIPFPAKE